MWPLLRRLMDKFWTTSANNRAASPDATQSDHGPSSQQEKPAESKSTSASHSTVTSPRQQVYDARLRRERTTSAWNQLTRIMRGSHEEIDPPRLYSRSLRSKRRDLRGLLCDEEQLRRYGLPLWRDEADVADALQISVGMLRHFTMQRHDERIIHYIQFTIPKRSGGKRQIMAPKRRLKKLQRDLKVLLVDRLPISEFAHGFVVGKSVATNARCHSSRHCVMTFDLQDFFPSITMGRIRGLLIASGYSYQVATVLALAMTESERQPVVHDGDIVHVPIGPRTAVQGAPSSPGLSNAICRRLDRRMAGLAKKFNWHYTRYADDLTFSGDDEQAVKPIRQLVRHICREEGFRLHDKKTKIARRGQRQRVTGVTVNQQVGLSRKERRRIRAAIDHLNRASPADSTSPHTASLRKHVEGKLAYLQMLNRDQADALRRRLNS